MSTFELPLTIPELGQDCEETLPMVERFLFLLRPPEKYE